MHIIDRYAYTNRIRSVDPMYKAGLALTALLLCLVLNKPLVGLLVVVWMWVLGVMLAGLPGRTFGGVLVGELAFLLLATAGVAVGVGLNNPAPTGGWAWNLGPLWFSCTPGALSLAANLILRALGATAAMNFLAMTTPMVDLLDLMRRWHVPALLIDLMTLMYRFVFLLLESLDRMYVAQDNRLGYSSLYRGVVSAGLLGSRLFIDAYQRSQRLQTALETRGYDGELRVLPTSYRGDRGLLLSGVAVVASLFLVWTIV